MGRKSKKPFTEVHKNTFGNSNAAEVLAKLLNEHRNSTLLARVSAYLSHNGGLLNSLYAIENHTHRLAVINMIADKIKGDTLVNIPAIVASYTKNVAMGQVKQIRAYSEGQLALQPFPNETPEFIKSGEEFQFDA